MDDAATTLLQPPVFSEMIPPRHTPRVHLVTPAAVERTVARCGVARVLTGAERRAFDLLQLERRRRDWLAGRLAAKRAVRAHYDRTGKPIPPYASIEIWNEASGAPRISIRGRGGLSADLAISIAHAEGAGVAGLVASPTARVGVDVELTRPIDLALVRRVLSRGEIARIDDSSADHPTALSLWTAKEAAMKAVSDTCTALREVELEWSGGRTTAARVASTDAHPVVVRHRVIGPYTVAVAWSK